MFSRFGIKSLLLHMFSVKLIIIKRLNSIVNGSNDDWNNFQELLKSDISKLKRTAFKKLTIDHLFKRYET